MAETTYVSRGRSNNSSEGFECSRGTLDFDALSLAPSSSYTSGAKKKAKSKKEGSAVKNARLKAAEVERVNRVMNRRMEDLKREPPSKFHAPNGYKSLTSGRTPGQQKNPMMQGKETSKPMTEWPPPVDDTKMMNRATRQREIKQANTMMASKLEDKYKIRPDSFVMASKLGEGVDCRDKWQKRTGIYRQPSTKGAAGSSSGGRRTRPESAPSGRYAGVPKTLGVALCSGCGKKDFFGADGKKLRPCDHCASVWYCSDTCASVDWQHHKQMCKHVGQGVAWPATPAPEDCWVSNAGMAHGRKLLKEKTKRYPEGDATRRIQQEVDRVALQDAHRRAATAEVEKRAYFGMEGPRPCAT